MAENTPIIELRQRVRWYVTMRWYYLFVLAVAGLTPLYLDKGWSEDFRNQLSIALAAVFLNIAVLFITRYRFRTKTIYAILAAAQISFDIFLVTWILYQNGAIESRSIILYAIPIVMTGALLGRAAIYFAGTASAVAYGTLISLDHFGVIHPPNAIFPFAHSDNFFYISSLFFYSSVFIAISVVTDYVGRLIREREQMEEEMRALSAKNAVTEAIIKSMGSALVSINLKGQITLVNDSFEELTGWKKSEVTGRQVDEILPLLDGEGRRVPADKRPMTQLAESPNISEHVHALSGYAYARKDGTSFPFTGFLSPIVVSNRVLGITNVFEDTTASQKLEQLKSNFVALVSHQLKTPIGEISGYVENMLYGLVGEFTNKQREYLEHIHDVTRRASKLVTDLLDISIIERGVLTLDIKPVDLGPVISEVEKIYDKRLYQKGLKLVFKGQGKNISVMADENKLVEVVSNVVANSISYSKKGKTITIDISATEQEGEVYVSDQGIGMSKETIKNLFHKDKVLSGAPTADAGTGLGLYLAKQLMNFMNGDIEVVSTSDKGTTICIKLPLVKG